MKLESVTQTLEEGIKFTNKEIQLVKQEARNFKIGVEYEYNVDKNKVEEYLGEDFELEDEQETMSIDDVYETSEYTDEYMRIYNEAVDEALEEEHTNFVQNRVEEIKEEIHSEDFYSFLVDLNDEVSKHPLGNEVFHWAANWDLFNENINTIKEMGIENVSAQTKSQVFSQLNLLKAAEDIFNNVDYDVMSYIAGTDYDVYVPSENEDFIKEIENVYDALNELVQLDIPTFAGYEQDSKQLAFEFPEYINDLKRFIADSEDFFDYYEYFLMAMEPAGLFSMFNNPHNFGSKIDNKIDELVEEVWVEDEEEYYRNKITDSIDDHGLISDQIDLYDIVLQIENNQGIVVVDYEGNPYFDRDMETKTYNKVTAIRNILHHWNIDSNEINQVTTDPSVPDGVETISNALDLPDALELMKKMFKHISDVGSTSDTTGMHVNMSFKGYHFTKDNFNPTKLVMLADPKLMSEFFPARNYVEDMFDIGTYQLVTLALEYNKNKNLTKTFSSQVQLSKKYQGINFSHIKTHVESERRIEFRYFGGDGYEQRYNTMEWNIYRFAYLMMVAFSDGFAENEYKKALIKYLDREVKDNKLMKQLKLTSFTDLGTFCRKNMISSVAQFENEANYIYVDVRQD